MLCKDKSMVRVVGDSSDMYASIDLVSDKLARQLRKFKERKYNKRTREATTDSFVDEIDEAEEEEAAGEAEATLAALEVMRSKKFSMPAIDLTAISFNPIVVYGYVAALGRMDSVDAAELLEGAHGLLAFSFLIQRLIQPR